MSVTGPLLSLDDDDSTGAPGSLRKGTRVAGIPCPPPSATARALFLFTSPSLASARSSAFSALLPSSPDERNIRPGQHAPLRHANDTLPSSSFERPFSFRRLRMVRFTRTQRTAARFPFQKHRACTFNGDSNFTDG